MYIDDGPFLPSLEHLVEHFMRFADGLPVNLKYPVLPKPKPPLPLFSTMPRSSHKKSLDAIEMPQNLQRPNENCKQNINVMSQKHTQILPTKQNPSNVKKKPKEHTSSVFSTLRLISPKKSSILDSVSTLRKSKHKQKCDLDDEKADVSINDESELKHAESLLKNISFSTDFSSLNRSTDSLEFYNIPKNNAPVSNDHILNKIEDSNLGIETKTEEEVDYLTKSDLIIERERNNNKICNER